LLRTTRATSSRAGISPHRTPKPFSKSAVERRKSSVLRLVLGEAKERPQPGLVAVDVPLRRLQRLRNDVLLDVREEVAVRIAHDLVELELLAVLQTADLVHSREPVRKEPLGVVEVPALQDLPLGPGDLERVLQNLRIRVVVGKHGVLLSRSHDRAGEASRQWELRPGSGGFGAIGPGHLSRAGPQER